MPEVVVRKKLTCVEEIFHEGGPVAVAPLRRAAALAVIRNPFAGSYVANIEGFMDDLKPLGLDMARALVAALGGTGNAEGGNCALAQKLSEFFADGHEFGKIFHVLSGTGILDYGDSRSFSRGRRNLAIHFALGLFHKRGDLADFRFHRFPFTSDRLHL